MTDIGKEVLQAFTSEFRKNLQEQDASSGNSELLLRDERGLMPCPCGKHPTELVIVDAGQGGKWAYVYGDCCSKWNIEFRTQYHPLDSNECMALALEAWNEAPRRAQ